MGTYQYQVIDATGALRTGQSEADSREVLLRRLQEQGFNVSGVVEVKVRRQATFGPVLRVRPGVLLEFWSQLSVLLDADTPPHRALRTCIEQTKDEKLRRVLTGVLIDIETGVTLRKSVAKYPWAFDPYVVGMISSGELGSNLPEAVRRIYVHLDKEAPRKAASRQRAAIIVLMLLNLVVLIGIYSHLGHIRLGR